MLTSVQLKEILNQNQIKGYSHYTKSKLIDFVAKMPGKIFKYFSANNTRKFVDVLDLVVDQVPSVQ